MGNVKRWNDEIELEGGLWLNYCDSSEVLNVLQ